MQVKTEKCTVCAKSVYAQERLSADEKVFHKACFKCSECKKTLALGNYASMDAKTFCKYLSFTFPPHARYWQSSMTQMCFAL